MDRIYQYQYHLHTENMIAFIIARGAEDEVLARGMRYERLHRLAVNSHGIRAGIRDYRQAAAKAFDPANRFARLWWWIARYHAFTLRQWVGVYSERAGYDPTWRRRYHRRSAI